MNVFILVISLLLIPWSACFATPAPDAPGVSWTDGTQYTVTGTGFLTKSSGPPILWDTFESGTLGSSIIGQNPTIGAAWYNYGPSNPMSRSTPTYKMWSSARGTWPSTATAITPGSDTEDGAGEYGMYCSNASAVLLIGNSTSANFGANGDSFPAATSTMYNEDGYTCVTQ